MASQLPPPLSSSSDRFSSYARYRAGSVSLGRQESFLHDGFQTFQHRLYLLREQAYSGQPEAVLTAEELEEELPNALGISYKGRLWKGTLLHYAIKLDSESEQEASNTDLVLRAGARLDSWATGVARGQEAKVSPIHLAAGLNNLAVLRLLHAKGLDVNLKSKHAGDDHYAAIHEACFLRRRSAVECLLELRADPDIRNINGEVPLHLVAKNGDHVIATMLVDAKADLTVRVSTTHVKGHRKRLSGHKFFGFRLAGLSPCPQRSLETFESEAEKGKDLTPLDIAIRGDRRFPKDKLHVLAPFCHEGYHEDFLGSIEEICTENMPAARALVASLKSQFLDKPERRKQVLQSMIEHEETSPIVYLASMLKIAPEVALDIMELMVVRPEAQESAYHELPAMANFEERSEWMLAFRGMRLRSVHTHYAAEDTWTYDSQTQGDPYPAWHDSLAPPPKGSLGDFEVDIKVLQIPNILDIRILHAINNLASGDERVYERFFNARVVEALVVCSWKLFRAAVNFQITVDLLVVSILTVWALEEKDRLSHKEKYRTLSVVTACVISELFNRIFQLVQHVRCQFNVSEYFGLTCYWDLLSALALAAFIVFFGDLSEDPAAKALFCVNVLLRWFKLAQGLRLVTGVGDKILAITSSVFPMMEFLIFAALIYIAFFTAFASIRGDVSLEEIFHMTFFSVITTDGDAFDSLEALDHHGKLTFGLLFAAIMVFTVCILNLMIAVYGHIYTNYEAKAMCLFMQERCRVIEQFVLRWSLGNSLPEQRFGRWARLGLCFLGVVLVVLWVVVLALFHPGSRVGLVVSSLIFATAIILVQATLTKSQLLNKDLVREQQRKRMHKDSAGAQPVEYRAMRSLRSCDVLEDDATEEGVEQERPYHLWLCHRIDEAEREALSNPSSRAGDLNEVMERLKQLTEKVDGLLVGSLGGAGVVQRKSSVVAAADSSAGGSLDPLDRRRHGGKLVCC